MTGVGSAPTVPTTTNSECKGTADPLFTQRFQGEVFRLEKLKGLTLFDHD